MNIQAITSRVGHWPLAGLMALALAACGGGGGGDKTPAVSTLTGQFVDGPVKGLCYISQPSGLSGVSNANGEYQYKKGDTVTFSIPTAPGNCRTGMVELGEAEPVPPASGNAVTPVLSLTNGARVALVLNALNHGTMGQMNVADLTVPEAQVTQLRKFIANGAAQGTSAAQVLQPVQTAVFQASNTPPAGASAPAQTLAPTLPVTPQFESTVQNHAQQTMLAGLPGTLWFFVNEIHYFKSSTETVYVHGLQGAPKSAAITIDGDTITKNAYGNKAKVIALSATEMTVQFMPAGGAAQPAVRIPALQPVTLADVAGKMITLKGEDGCNPSSVFSADGTQMTSLSGKTTSAVSIDPALPGVLKLTSDKKTQYFGFGKDLPIVGSLVFLVTTVKDSTDDTPDVQVIPLLANPATPASCGGGSGGTANPPSGTTDLAGAQATVNAMVGNWKQACVDDGLSDGVPESRAMSLAYTKDASSALKANVSGMLYKYKGPPPAACAGTPTRTKAFAGSVALDGNVQTINGMPFYRAILTVNGMSEKTAIRVSGNLIYSGNTDGPLDAEGYPTTADAHPFTR